MVEEKILLPGACRCCLLEDKDMVYVFDVLDEFEMQISDLIVRNGAITILENDCFSKHICGNCLNDLAIAERFVLRCRKTGELLQSLANAQEKSDSDSEKVSYVLMAGPVYVLPDETTEDDLEQPSEVAVEANTAKELEELYCNAEENEPPDDGEENVSDQLGLIILNEEDASIAEGETLEVDETVYTDLLQNVVPTTVDVSQSESWLKEGTCYEQPPLDDEQHQQMRTIIDSDNECNSVFAATNGKMYDFKHSCNHCGASFVTSQNYARHLQTHQILACQTCLVVFNSQQELHTHENDCHERIRPLGATKQRLGHVTSTSASHHVEAKRVVQKKKSWECTYCGKHWICQSALTVHLRTHTGERPYLCNYCPKRFPTPAGLELHERRHVGTKPYSCSVCGRGFAESSNLKVHMLQHTREKPHVCTVCNRAFSRVYLLQLHLRTHTGEKPFVCEVCQKGFAQQGDLAAHRRIHSGERPYVCGICGKSFIKSNALSQHKKRHEKHHLLLGTIGTDGTF